MRRRLIQPVISVGALAAGGSGKTPLTAHLARTLVAMGERPVVLSRGYGRTDAVDGAVVVRDMEQIVGELATSGDEPWMLARALDGVGVVVAEDRHVAGRLAETHLGATVHLLDDGFQHLQLERGTDLLLVSAADLYARGVLPAGPLRERLATARHADAVLLVGVTEQRRERVAAHLPPSRRFDVRRQIGSAVVGRPHHRPGVLESGTRVTAVAGIARPERFFDDVRASGFDLVSTMVFPDHHPYTRRTAMGIQRAARSVRAEAIVTTEKDHVRLERWLPFDPALATMPLTLSVEPADEFRGFLAGRLAADRSTVP